MKLGLSPSEFRSMSPREVGVWFNANRPVKYYGGMSETQAQSITDRISANPDKYD